MGTSEDFRGYRDYYKTQYALIKSPSLLKRIAQTVNERYGTHYGVKQMTDIVSVTPIKDTQLVDIKAKDHSPKMAAALANAVADVYMHQNLERNLNVTNEAARWLSEKIEEQRGKLAGAEQALQQYRVVNSINVLPDITGDGVGEDIKSQYAVAQAQFANYSQRYTNEHPKMIELKAQIGSLKNKIHGLESSDLGDKTTEYRDLERQVLTNKRMYNILLARLKEIDLSSTLTVNNISIIDMARVPVKPLMPNVPVNMSVAVVVGLMFGIGLAFFVDYLDTTVKSPEDIKVTLELPFLGGIPFIKGDDVIQKDTIVHNDSKSPISEAYREIRTEILYSMPRDNTSKTVLITSAEPQAGKTTTSTNIALALAQQGVNVLLVDADLRKPQIHRIFGIEKKTGLSEFLLGHTTFGSLLNTVGIDNLKVVISGRMPSNPAEIIGSEKMKEFVEQAKKEFNFVVFDSPPIISVADATILADMVDSTVQVVRSGKAHTPLVLRAKEKLLATRTRSLGVILNDIKAYHSQYYPYYYSRYYRYYGGEGDKSRRRRTKENTTVEDKIEEISIS